MNRSFCAASASCFLLTSYFLLLRREDQHAALRLPVISEGKSERRGMAALIGSDEVRLMMLREDLDRTFVIAEKPQRPARIKASERDSGIVLHNERALIEKESAHLGKSIGMHEIRGRFDEAWPLALRAAPT